jgi:hypothetical protein
MTIEEQLSRNLDRCRDMTRQQLQHRSGDAHARDMMSRLRNG